MKNSFVQIVSCCLFALAALTFQSCESDPCEGLECNNGGVCIDGICSCIENYAGVNCEFDTCEDVVCLNGSICVFGDCECPEAYGGDMCEIFLCDLITCQNNGTCTNGICDCPSGITGDSCEMELRIAFYGMFEAVQICTDTSGADTLMFSMTIPEQMDTMYTEFLLENIANQAGSSITGLVTSGTSFSIDSQSIGSPLPLSILGIGSQGLNTTTGEINMNYVLIDTDTGKRDTCETVLSPM